MSEKTETTRKPALLVLDVETSGLDPARHGIIEIGVAVLDEEMMPIASRSWRVRLWEHAAWDDEAEAVHGVTRESASSDPSRYDPSWALSRLIGWIFGYCGIARLVVAGMNPGFDLGMLMASARACGMESAVRDRLSHRSVDLHTLAWAEARRWGFEVDRESLHTDAIYDMLGMRPEPRPHSALNGVLWEAEALRLLLCPDACEPLPQFAIEPAADVPQATTEAAAAA